MLSVGLTGGIGSGKSTVARRLRELGAVVVDADAIARDILAPGTPGLKKVAERFGGDLLGPDGSLDRAALAARAFGDAASRRALEEITHPLIEERTAEAYAAAPPDAVVVHDVPLLVEKDMGARYHLVLVVHADEQTRLRRLAGRGLGERDARARMAHQATDDQRRTAADVILDNNSDEAHLLAQVDAIWRERLVPFERNVREGRVPGVPRRPPSSTTTRPGRTRLHG